MALHTGAFGPSAKSVGRPLFLSYQFSPTFFHSPPSALRGRAEAAKRVSGDPSAALRTGWRHSGPLQKVSADPYFYRTSFPPLFPTPRPRRSGAVLRPRTRCRAARAPCSGTDRRAPSLCKKCRQTPILIVPVFPHFSPLRTRCSGGRTGGARLRVRAARGPRSLPGLLGSRPSAAKTGPPGWGGIQQRARGSWRQRARAS